MNTNLNQSKFEKRNWVILGAVITAGLASLCCALPLLLLMLGVSGAWVSTFTVFEPFRPVFIDLTIIFLAMTFYKFYGKKEVCEDGSCSVTSTRKGKKLLWISTLVIGALLVLPSLSPYLLTNTVRNQNKNTAKESIKPVKVLLNIKNMTCISCTVAVKKSLLETQGVLEADVSFNPPVASVLYDPNKVSLEKIIQATAIVGYPSFKKE